MEALALITRLHLLALCQLAVHLDAAYWRLRLIAWIHTTLGAVAVVPWNPKRQTNRTCLPPTWTADELGKRTSIERDVPISFAPPHLWLLTPGKGYYHEL